MARGGVVAVSPNPSLTTSEGGEEDARGSLIDDQAEAVLADNVDTFGATAPAFRMYLAQRVPAPRQAPYLLTWVSWLQLAQWRTATGAPLEVEKRLPLLLETVYALLATDEREGYSRPEGDPDNLRVKLEYALKQIGRSEPGQGNGVDRAAAAKEAERREQEAAIQKRQEERATQEKAAKVARWEEQNPEAAAELRRSLERMLGKPPAGTIGQLAWEATFRTKALELISTST